MNKQPTPYLTEAELKDKIDRLSVAIGNFDRAGELRLAIPLVEQQGFYQGLLDNYHYRKESL